MNKEIKALLILLIIPLLWGVTFPLTREIVRYYTPAQFVYWRFLLAALLMLVVFFRVIRRNLTSLIELRYGLLLGLINGAAYYFQTDCLKYIESSRAAFLVGTYVIMVPFLLPLFALGRPKKIDVMAAFVCLLGIYLMSGANLHGFNYGDVLAILSAFGLALGIIVCEKVSLVSKSYRSLTFYQIIFTILIPVGILGKSTIVIPSGYLFWVGILYCAVFATIIPMLLQLKYQKYVGSSKAAIIFNLEALTASLCAWIYGEHISGMVILGGSVIIFSAILENVLKLIQFIFKRAFLGISY